MTPSLPTRLLHRLGAWLARVTAVAPGRSGDGLAAASAGGALDKPWPELSQEFVDAREAWRKNPLARRLITLTTAYVVGDGIRLGSDNAALARFLERFEQHPQNNLLLRQAGWCDELARSGELFFVLHTNPADGMSYVRTLPAAAIDRVEWRPGDYETELRYHEQVAPGDPDYPDGRWWLSPVHDDAFLPAPDGPVPLVLHFAVNRPTGCVRGESDLAPVLPWLRRYARWLEDRVRLNAAIRSFLWVVRVPGHLVAAKQAEHARPPEPGSVLVVDRNSEEWQAVAPNLNANDAQADGRAIRWMVVAGGPGVGLVDMGESETSNLATAEAMGEQRWRVMRQRQAYFGYSLATLAVTAYNRAVRLGRVAGREQPVSAIRLALPDISSTDNARLGSAARDASQALSALAGLGLGGAPYRRAALRLVFRFAGEELPEADLDRILAGDRTEG